MDYNEYQILLRLKDFLIEENRRLLFLKEENKRLLESRTHEHMVFMQGFQAAIIFIDKFIKEESGE